MGSKYNWYIGKYWIEYTPWVYLRINTKSAFIINNTHMEGWKTSFEFWI